MARKQSLETTIESNRPPVSAGRLDQRLAGLALALRGVVAETQEMPIYPPRQLDNDSLPAPAAPLPPPPPDPHPRIPPPHALHTSPRDFLPTPLPPFLPP